LAEDVAVVDIIARGRFELGVGTCYKLEEFWKASESLSRNAVAEPKKLLVSSGVFLRANRSA